MGVDLGFGQLHAFGRLGQQAAALRLGACDLFQERAVGLRVGARALCVRDLGVAGGLAGAGGGVRQGLE